MNVSIAVLAVVFVLIAVRRVGGFRIPMWLSMAGGAVAVLVAGEITPGVALRAIDLDVMLFLFGMFVIAQALVASGYLYCLADRLFARVSSSSGLLLAVMLGAGLGAALLMNDALAIIATPLMIRLAEAHRIEPKVLLLALAYAVTIGSVMSPIGNPQNLLIALHGGMADPFTSFLYALGIPTLLNLVIAYTLLRIYYRAAFHAAPLQHTPATLTDPALARLARLSLWILMGLIVSKIVLIATRVAFDLRLSHIALAAALPLLLLSPRRFALLRHMDNATLVFFAAMFVLMASVWQSGFFQARLGEKALDVTSPMTMMGLSVVLSQFISNVPLVALYLPLLDHAGASQAAWMALAAGSTIAGNFLILGAASNVIILQSAERQRVSVSFYEFARIGVPLGVINVTVYGIYLHWLYAP